MEQVNPLAKNVNYSVGLFIKFILLLILISVFVPFAPKMPASTLDSSWAVGLNQAVVQGLAFGKEIIFTLGPYSFIYTKTYHPALDALMIGGSLYLALSYWLCLLLLMKGFRGSWALAFSFFLFIMVYARDSLLFSYPLLVGLFCYKNLSSPKPSFYFPFWLSLFLAPFGLMILVKGSLLLLCGTISSLCCLFFISNKRRMLALTSLLVPFISMLIFWVSIGQPLINLPTYLSTSILLASDFTEAMSVNGNKDEIILYCLNAIVLLGSIAWQKNARGVSKLFLFGIFFAFLFISFKAGFARHYGHALIPGTSIMMATLFLPLLVNNTKLLITLFCVSLNTWYVINNHYTRLSISDNFKSNYSSAWHGLKNRISSPNSLEQDFALSMSFLSQQAEFPIFQGTTDIYSYNQSYLIASNNQWSPRPVFQSYSVFNSILAEKNKQHLQGAVQPDNIIFKIEPIDERIPALEDGRSWPLLLANYQPVDLKNDFLYLRKKKESGARKDVATLIAKEQHLLGESVTVPRVEAPIYVELEINPTLLGRIATLLFKSSQLYMTFTLENGIQRHYRLVANMAKAGFLLSPLIENTTEFTLLYVKNSYLNEKNVVSLTLSTDGDLMWKPAYVIHFKQLNY
ncbi:hypothetical protein [Legionella saoudiensis]|uniref:hypothetical protein n=1 Tax=Legionella saoudiensis TaxID=1750561 RepID=UPI000730B688|nr:hypothetical protein [Legionella saoudiensis]